MGHTHPIAMREHTHTRLAAMRDGSLALFSSYDAGLVAALKASVPSHARQWNPDDKSWRIAPQYGATVAALVQQHLGVVIQSPLPPPRPQTDAVARVVRLEYLGAAKDRGGSEAMSYGYCDGSWSLVFPLSVLKDWFEPGVAALPGEAQSLYGILGVALNATQAEIKQAYRRAAKQWHPDICKEEGAAAQFRLIGDAYEVLVDPFSRRKYDGARVLAASAPPAETYTPAVWWPPLRCGLLLIDMITVLGRMLVQHIGRWDDIVDQQGRTLVTYWPRGAEQFAKRWV